MPINEFGIGVSEETPQKQQDLQGLIGYLASVAKKTVTDGKAWHCDYYHAFDLYAARPFYPGVDHATIKGSAVLTIETLQGISIPYRAYLFEVIDDNAQALTDHFQHDPNVTVYAGDNANNLPALFQWARPRYGHVYIDPNQINLPTILLSKMYSLPCNRYMDLFVYIGAANLKRAVASSYTQYDENLRDFMAHIDKTHWLIREPKRRQQWSFLVGTNWKNVNPWEKRGFYRFDSPEGQAIWRKIAFTEQEIQDMVQPSLLEELTNRNWKESYR